MAQRRIPIKPQGALCVDKAWLLGFWAGDGTVQVEEDGTAHVSANCGAEKEDEQLAEHIADLFESFYGVRATVRLQQRTDHRRPYWQPIVYRRAIAEDILSFGPIGTYDWLIPVVVLKGGLKVQAKWLSGFFDADGSVAFKIEKVPGKGTKIKRNVTASSVNRKGLEQVKSMLEGIGIRVSPLHECKNRDGLSIGIYDQRSLERFAAVVGFRCERKARKLREAIASYQRAVPNLLAREVKAAFPEVLRRRARKESFKSIAEAMSFASAEIPKGMVKRAFVAGKGKCMICLGTEATHSIPRVIRGRSSRSICEPCLVKLEPDPPRFDGPGFVKQTAREVAEFLDAHHYLGARPYQGSCFALRNMHGVLLFSVPSASKLPREWLELSRWCVVSKEKNAGSKQWALAKEWLLKNTDYKTVVSYSDPASGFGGTLYRAAGWEWAPPAHFVNQAMCRVGRRPARKSARRRLPANNRWICSLQEDPLRAEYLEIKHPWIRCRGDLNWLCPWPEPKWKNGRPKGGARGRDHKRWLGLLESFEGARSVSG